MNSYRRGIEEWIRVAEDRNVMKKMTAELNSLGKVQMGVTREKKCKVEWDIKGW